MKNLKKISRQSLASISGGAITPIGSNCCGSWCNGSWMSCRVHHFECPPDSDTNPPAEWDGYCPM